MAKNATNVTNLRIPIQALHGDKPVRLLQTGDVEGNSPSYFCIDGDGRSYWASVTDIQVVDPAFLPAQMPRQFSTK
jgi:hypothetical protein